MSDPVVHLTLRGPFIPYVRMTQRSKFVNDRAQAYIASQAALKKRIREQLRDANLEPVVLPRRTPFSVRIQITMSSGLHKSDLDNQVKALMDAAQGLVFPDDRWCDEFPGASRRLGEEDAAEVWFQLDGNAGS